MVEKAGLKKDLLKLGGWLVLRREDEPLEYGGGETEAGARERRERKR